jgi:hypothetical protein
MDIEQKQRIGEENMYREQKQRTGTDSMDIEQKQIIGEENMYRDRSREQGQTAWI